MGDQVLVSSIKTAHPGSLPDYSPVRARVARFGIVLGSVLYSCQD